MAVVHNDDSLPLPEFAEPPRLLVVVAPFVRSVTDMLLAGALGRIETAGGVEHTISVPGALEISPAIRLAANTDKYDGYVALGCVMRGETTHYETVCQESARGLTLLGLSGLCIGNGILTVEDIAQARVRSDPAQQDKGGDAAAAALHLIALSKQYTSDNANLGFRLWNEAGGGLN